jgi:hypothetical protein
MCAILIGPQSANHVDSRHAALHRSCCSGGVGRESCPTSPETQDRHKFVSARTPQTHRAYRSFEPEVEGINSVVRRCVTAAPHINLPLLSARTVLKKPRSILTPQSCGGTSSPLAMGCTSKQKNTWQTAPTPQRTCISECICATTATTRQARVC